MILYKYRSIDNLDRDMALYGKNCFWASTKEELNDENEFTYNAGPFYAELHAYEHVAKVLPDSSALNSILKVRHAADDIFKHANTCGVFSLSKSQKESSMWSLYASKGAGYCLMFDSELLMRTVEDVLGEQRFLLQVNYEKESPNIFLEDITDQATMFTKMLATKNVGWSNEQEVRIVTDKSGKQKFLPSALLGVVFGTNTIEETQNKILKALGKRDLEVYKLHKIENTYEYFQEVLSAIIHKDALLERESYDYKNIPAPTVDNFYVKAHITFSDYQSKIDFVRHFKSDIAERQCNVFLMDSITDLSRFTSYLNVDEEYVERHLVAEMYFDSDDVYVKR